MVDLWDMLAELPLTWTPECVVSDDADRSHDCESDEHDGVHHVGRGQLTL
jgi:hypothetical protein